VRPKNKRERRFAGVFKEKYGLKIETLTGPEAEYLLNFKDADSLRNRAVKAREETVRRTRAKILPDTPNGSGRIEKALDKTKLIQKPILIKRSGKTFTRRMWVRNDEPAGPPLAPNGQPSKITPLQWKQVRTPEFKAWFGDWVSFARQKIE